MHSLLMTLLERLAWTSLQTAVLVAALALVCRALPSLPAATRCRLWWLVSLQAVLGLVWAQPLQLAWLPASAALPLPAGALDSGTAPALAAVAAPLPWWLLALSALWLAGVVLMACRTVGQWRRSRALLAGAQPCDDGALVAALQLAAEAHGLRHAPRLCTSAQIDAPQIVGPLRPVLLLPAGTRALQGDALDLALTHELQHLQRRDLQWGLLPALAQHLLFFHPLLRLAVREYAQSREEAVDAAVIAGQGECRHDYGRLLLQLGVGPRPHLGVASAAPSMASLKRRLQSLQPRRACPKAVAMLLTVAVLALGVLPLRLVAAAPPPPPPAAPAAPRAPTAVLPPVPAAPAAPTAPAAAPPAAPPAPPAAPAAPPAPPVPEHRQPARVVTPAEPAGYRGSDHRATQYAALKALDAQMATLSTRVRADAMASLDAAGMANLAAVQAHEAIRAIDVQRLVASAQQAGRQARDMQYADARGEQERELAVARAERAQAQAEAQAERAQAQAEAAAERAQALNEGKAERMRAQAEAQAERARAQAEAQGERAQALAEAQAERAQAQAAARAERAAARQAADSYR